MFNMFIKKMMKERITEFDECEHQEISCFLMKIKVNNISHVWHPRFYCNINLKKLLFRCFVKVECFSTLLKPIRLNS